jgi:hypothetical protein
MIFKITEKKINTKGKANIFNVLISLILWIIFGILNYFILVSGDTKNISSYLICLIAELFFIVLISKIIILRFYSRKWIIIILAVIFPAALFVLFDVFIFLWETASFVGPTIL